MWFLDSVDLGYPHFRNEKEARQWANTLGCDYWRTRGRGRQLVEDVSWLVADEHGYVAIMRGSSTRSGDSVLLPLSEEAADRWCAECALAAVGAESISAAWQATLKEMAARVGVHI